MRFRHVAVEDFQGIEKAKVEFGPNLNILFGPNDLGKSTLAAAVRAALLIPAASSEGAKFSPWHKDVAAKVVLTFEDSDLKVWRVTKKFGSGHEAEFDYSKDGKTFTNDAKGRDVDRRVRELLKWGIPTPGGKGAPRGLPESFLAKVLLAPQTEVDAILAESLEKDGDDGGKVRLHGALAALAQDATLKKVLLAAQAEVEQYFTATGRRKTGRTSPFFQASEEVGKWQSELTNLQKQAEESKATEDLVAQQRIQRGSCLERVQAAVAGVAAAEARHAQEVKRAECASRLEDAKRALGVVDGQIQALAALEKKVEGLGEVAQKSEGEAKSLDAAREAAAASVNAAQEALRAASSEDGARARELRIAHIGKTLADLDAKEQVLKGQAERAQRAVVASEALEQARRALTVKEKELAAAQVAAKDADQKSSAAQQDDALAKGIVAYGQWRAASKALDVAAQARKEGADLRETAVKLDAQAEAAAASVRADLPNAEKLKQLRRLSVDLDRAKAALGGGLSITVRPKRSLSIEVTADGKKSAPAKHEKPLAIDADRVASLVIEDLVDIEVQAGAPDRRKAAVELQERWDAEASPVFAKAAVATLEALESLCAASDAARAAAEGFRAEAKRAREKVAECDARAAAVAAQAEQAAGRETALEGLDRDVLEVHFKALGASADSQAEALRRKTEKAVEAARNAKARADEAFQKASIQCQEVQAQCVRAQTATAEAAAAAGGTDFAVTLKKTAADTAALVAERGALTTEMKTLEADASSKVEAAKMAVEGAKKAAETASATHAAAVAKLEAARAAHLRAMGECDSLRKAVLELDRPAAQGKVDAILAELRAFPAQPSAAAPGIPAAQAALDAAKGALDDVTRQLDNAEGALQKVGGAVLRENLDLVKEALDASKEKEHAVEVDAQAWQLLRDVLRQVENDEGKHLGQALAGPVTVRFKELTAGRYGDLQIGPTLQAKGITGMGAAPEDVLEALSVGTKDQLATLLRVTIAEQLRSAIILDDHLVHTDPHRLNWFRTVLRKAAVTTQVIILTCRPQDYLEAAELPGADSPWRSIAGGAVRATDLGRLVQRHAVVAVP